MKYNFPQCWESTKKNQNKNPGIFVDFGWCRCFQDPSCCKLHQPSGQLVEVKMRSFTCWSFSDHNFLNLGVGNATLPGEFGKAREVIRWFTWRIEYYRVWIVGKSHHFLMDCCFGTSCFEMRYEEPWGWSPHFVIFCPDVAVVGLVPTFAGGR